MADPFTQAVRAALVQVRGGPGRSQLGTGFFIADRLILTCRHVIEGAGIAEVRFGEHTLDATVKTLVLAKTADVALLSTNDDAPAAPACVRLGSAASLYDKVRARGFPVRNDAPHEEQVTGVIEDLDFQHPREPWKSGARLIQFKESQIDQGLSGCPLICERTRRVIGVVSTTRGGESALGGVAVPAKLLLEDEIIREAQRGIQWDATVWADNPGAEDPFLDYYLDSRMPFFGRSGTLQELDDWLERGPQRGMLIVPSGKGKSSALARWYTSLRWRVADVGVRIRVQLVPISLRFDHARREEVLISLERAVAMLCGESLAARDGDGNLDLPGAIREGLARAAPERERRLLIIDGLDETLGWDVNRSLFPAELGAGVHILVSARALADFDVSQWRERLGWKEPIEVRTFDLKPLGLEELRQAVVSWWSVTAALAQQYAQRLLELTAGDTLVLGLYLGEYTASTLPVAPQLGGVTKGLEGFFDTWWREQRSQWMSGGNRSFENAVYKTLSVLAAGVVPMPRKMLLRVLQHLGSFDGGDLSEALQRLARFVVGSKDGYSVSHPELARWWWGRLREDGETEPIDAAFVTLAREMLAGRLADPAVETYLLQATPLHLQRLNKVALEDLAMLTGPQWKARHRSSDRWPKDYEAGLEIIDACCRLQDEAALRAGLPCSALGLRAEVALRRMSVVRFKRRISAKTAAALVRNGTWSGAQALEHVLATYAGDYPKIAALGEIAPLLEPREIQIAMESLVLEHDYAFSWDGSLGAWAVSAAATQSGAIDYSRIQEWAHSLEGIGAAVALFAHAATCSDDTRLSLLARSLDVLPSANSAQCATYVALATRLTQSFSLQEFAAAAQQPSVTPYFLAETFFGFYSDDPAWAAAALRVAWFWLSPQEIESHIRRLYVPNVEAVVAEAIDEPWRDWYPAFGAVWDVCSVDQAERLFRPFETYLKSESESPRLPRSLYTCAIQFASRLPQLDLPYVKARSARIAFGGGVNLPSLRALFRAEASVPSWQAPLSELILEVKDYKAEVLEAAADSLSLDLLEQQRIATRSSAGGARDRLLRNILTATATRSAEGARRALELAERIDDGAEYQLLVAYLQALTAPVTSAQRETVQAALHSLPYGDELRANVLSAIAPVMGPWTVAECEHWAPPRGASRSLALSFLLPYIEPADLDNPQSPFQLAIDGAFAESGSVMDAIQGLYRRTSLEATFAWTATMSEASKDTSGKWAAATIEALAQEVGPALVDRAVSFESEHLRARCCASLLSVCPTSSDQEKLWRHVEEQLVELSRAQLGHEIAPLLRRLSGGFLAKALELLDLEKRLLRRAAFSIDWMWLECARWLLPWASAELIDEEFCKGGSLVAVDSGEDRAFLRLSLAPRLLELGREGIAVEFAYDGAGAAPPQVHAAMVRYLRDARVAHALGRVVIDSERGESSVFAMGSEVRRLGAQLPRSVGYGLYEGFMAGTTTEAQFFLVLTGCARGILDLGMGKVALSV